MNDNDVTARAAAPPPASSRAADEIDLLAYARACWRHRYALLIVGLVVATLTYVINRRMTPTYEVTFRLMASEPRIGNEPEPASNVVAFRELVESPNLIASLLEEFQLDRPPHNLTPQEFIEGHLSVDVIRDSTIIVVAVRLTDQETLVRLARRYAARVVETAQALNTEGIDFTAKRIKEQRDAALARLAEADRALQDYREQAQVELLERDVDTMLERRPEALDLAVQIQAARARVRQGEEELARHERTRNVRRSVDSLPQDDVAGDGARERRPRPAAPVAGTEPRPAGAPPPPPPTPRAPARSPADPEPEDLRIRSELLDPYVNPVHDAVARDLASARTRLAALEQQRNELVKRLKLDAPAAEALTRLYVAQAQLATLRRDQEIARDAYLNAANKYEDARLQSSVRTPRLHILDAALPPDRPVAPRALRNTLAATLIALTIAAIAAIVRERPRATAS